MCARDKKTETTVKTQNYKMSETQNELNKTRPIYRLGFCRDCFNELYTNARNFWVTRVSEYRITYDQNVFLTFKLFTMILTLSFYSFCIVIFIIHYIPNHHFIIPNVNK